MTETIQQVKEDIAILQEKLQKLEEIEKHKTPCEIAYRDWWGWYPTTTWQNDIDRWNAFEKGYNASKVTEVEPSMINCVLLGNPPDGYVAWNMWYDEMGSKGILHNLKISSKEYQPKNEWKTVALLFGKKLPVIPPYGYDELSPNAWYMWVVFNYDYYIKQRDIESGRYPTPPQTPEQIEKSLKEAFVKAQQTEEWKETQKLIDEEDNDKNFKNSLDLIKEWGEKNKPPTLYEILMKWWINHLDMEQSDKEIVDGLVNIIDNEFIPPSNDRNGYEWEKCLKMMRENLR